MTSEVPASYPRSVLSASVLGALAVPARFAIMSHLLSAGPRTATQCSKVVGESPSNCSWHLRELAKVGLVEQASPEGRDGRTTVWQATVVGFEATADDDPASATARAAVDTVAAMHVDRLFARFLATRPELPPTWVDASGASDYALRLTTEELGTLLARIDELLSPYRVPVRADSPDDSEVVHLTLRAFLDPDVRQHS